MSLEDNKTVIRRFYNEVINERKLNVLDEIMAEDYVDHHMIYGGPIGREGYKRAAFTSSGFLSAFPDVRNSIEDLVAEGDKVVARWTATGTHSGEFLGIQPTGKQVSWGGISIFRLENGKIVERWPVLDRLSMMQQLSAVL